jgi:metal-responsive CopG/Arc/MetJ family transcriptional regulator
MRKRRFIRQLGIPVEEQVYQTIVSLCDEQEITKSEWVRGAIEAKLAQNNNNHKIKEG